jgi:hypothetical protein
MPSHGNYDRNALQTFIYSILAGLDGCSLDEPEDRDIVAAVLLDMLSEYFGVS